MTDQYLDVEYASRYTARARRVLSAPANELLKRGLLVGRILDFGSGKGDLAKFLDGDIHEWDPNFQSAPRGKYPRGKFDVVCCIYVLNVLRPRERRLALAEAKAYVRHGGCLYVAVRRDPFEDGPTSKGAQRGEQYHVQLPMNSLMHRSGKFEIYSWKKPKR